MILGRFPTLLESYRDCLLSTQPYLLVTQFHGDKETAYTLANPVKSELLTTHEWLDVLVKLAKGLGYIHNQGWIHNDLKENNVVLHSSQEQWRPVIIDFGK
ncbi:MAG: hypothetical protein DSY43_05850, partial [Gammaproteobacteria bacterium]